MTSLATSNRPRQPAPARGRGALGAALLGLLAALGVAVVYLLFVRTTVGQVVDEAAMQAAEVPHPRVAALLRATLDGTSLLPLALVSLAAATIGLLRGRRDLAVAAGVLVLGANLTTQVLKAWLDRPGLDSPGPNSLPSGHTTAAVAVTFALVLVLPYAGRAVVALLGAGYATVTAVATVWAGWHRPSDTVAALLVCLAWGGLVVAAVRAGPGVAPGRSAAFSRAGTGRVASRLATVPLAVAGAAAATVAVAAVAAVALSVSELPLAVPDLGAFLAGAAGIAAAAAATFLVWLRLVGGADPRPRR